MTNGEKLEQVFPDGICPFSKKWLDCEYKKSSLSSALEKNSQKLENVSPVIDWNNCHTTEQLGSIATTKNDLVVDCISRAEAIKCLECDFDITGKENMKTVVNYINSAHDKIVNLPSVTPIRPKGHWIPIYQGDEIIGYRCSECEFGNTFGKGTIGMNFCPCCGSDNREVEE